MFLETKLTLCQISTWSLESESVGCPGVCVALGLQCSLVSWEVQNLSLSLSFGLGPEIIDSWDRYGVRKKPP